MESTRDGDGDIAVCDPGVLHSKARAQSSSWPMRHSSRRRCRSCDNNTRTNAACRAVYTARGDTAAISSEACREALILACRTSHASVLSVVSNLLLRPNMLLKPHVSHFHVHTDRHTGTDTNTPHAFKRVGRSPQDQHQISRDPSS